MSGRAATRSPGVVLIGMRGVGKSTVGRALAERLSLPFVDLDREIERAAGASVKRIFAGEGEARFRARETAALAAVAKKNRACVLSTGGGVVERRENDGVLRSLGTVVWLQANLATIRARIAASGSRPALLRDDPIRELRALSSRRAPRYRALADLSIRCGRARPHRIAERIAQRVRSQHS